MAHSGRVLQFDGARGYGFIAPDEGGADVFFHVNEFNEDDERLIAPGTRVQFEIMDGERGKKAYAVAIMDKASATVPAETASVEAPVRTAPESFASDDDDATCDVFTVEEMRSELNEMFLGSSPDLTVGQIGRLRDDFVLMARKHGWVAE